MADSEGQGGDYRKTRTLAVSVIAAILLLLTLGEPGGVLWESDRRRCERACTTYMQGRPGSAWVAKHADGPGYNALLLCMNKAMLRPGPSGEEGCWEPRVKACRTSCVQAGAGPS